MRSDFFFERLTKKSSYIPFHIQKIPKTSQLLYILVHFYKEIISLFKDENIDKRFLYHSNNIKIWAVKKILLIKKSGKI